MSRPKIVRWWVADGRWVVVFEARQMLPVEKISSALLTSWLSPPTTTKTFEPTNCFSSSLLHLSFHNSTGSSIRTRCYCNCPNLQINTIAAACALCKDSGHLELCIQDSSLASQRYAFPPSRSSILQPPNPQPRFSSFKFHQAQSLDSRVLLAYICSFRVATPSWLYIHRGPIPTSKTTTLWIVCPAFFYCMLLHPHAHQQPKAQASQPTALSFLH